MKRILIFTLAIFCLSYIMNAQVNPHAIGIRVGGDGDINGVELSYQQGFNDVNRLELDLGFGGNSHHSRFFLAGIYHWDWNITEGLNWYVGPGAGIGYFDYDDSDGYLNVALGGQIGLEYDFNTLDAPILLSLDVRPMWDFIGDEAGFGWGVALGVRYTW
jgi:opacity protein-like surface antigen